MKKRIFFICAVILLFLTGCWDSVEINKRAFVLGIGLDKPETQNDIDVTYEIILPNKISRPGGQGGGEGEAIWNITKRTPMIMTANNTMHHNIDKTIDLSHMQALVIGGELAKEGIYDDVDFFFRRPQMRRRTKVVYTDGKAKDILSFEPKTTKSPSNFLSEILSSNIRYTHTLDHPIDLGQVVQNIRDDFDFVVSRVEKLDKEIIVSGAAAFKKGVFVTDIGENDAKVRGWFIEEISRGTIDINDPQKPEKKLVFEITEGKSQLKPIFNGNKVDFELSVQVEGDLAEKEDINFFGTLEGSYLKAVEDEVEKVMTAQIYAAYDKYIRENKVDIFRLKPKIKHYNIKYYDENTDRLNDIIAESNVKATVTAKVRRIGLVK